MIGRSFIGGLVAAGTLAGLLTAPLACGPVGPPPGDTRDCGGEARVMLDCSSEVSYQGMSGEADIAVLDIASAKGGFEEKAIRRVNEQVEQFAATHSRACKDYNACVLSKEEYREEAAEARRRLSVLPALMKALDSAETPEERTTVLDQIYRGVVPDEKRSEEITFRMGMIAQIPAELGGGTYSLAPGGAVPTGALTHFEVDVSRQAYVYIFQVNPEGAVDVLFPHPEIGTRNPLPGGVASRIPKTSGAAFKVNDKGIGTEKIYIVVSHEALDSLDGALARVKDGDVKRVGDDQLLSTVALVEPPSSGQACRSSRDLVLTGSDSGGGSGCRKSRGLELTGGDADAGSTSDNRGLQVRTAPGDDLIVTVFSFQHLTADAYKAAGGAGAANHKSHAVGH